MKNLMLRPLIAVAAIFSACTLTANEPAIVKIVNNSGSKIYFQPESDLNYTEIKNTDTVINIDESPVYYRLMDSDGKFYPVFITPNSETFINVSDKGVAITGTNEKENAFMRKNPYVGRGKDNMKTYSKEWVEYNDKEIARLDSLIDNSGLNPEFASIHKLYNRYILLNQKLGGVTLSKVFSKDGEKIEIDNNFYDFLNTLSFDDEKVLSTPKWFDVIDKTIESKEARNLIKISNDDYMSIYAKEIGNEKIRSHYLVKLLAKTLKYNYLTDFERQLPKIRPLITDAKALEKLPALEKEYAQKVKESENVAPGIAMPDFVCKDVNGKEYRFSDLKGDYVIIDFWFTGCVPCRAEMPYFYEIAKDFDGKGVKFLSLSVDTGDVLYGRWEKMMRNKPETPGLLSVNLPDGFNSPLLKTLNIKGVPRIMLIDREGKIVESYAKRPSDPKLRQQLQQLTQTY